MTEHASIIPLKRGEARRRAMMDAAWQSVMEKGFAGTTLDDVIARSGGSKATLYHAFGDKDGLLRAVMREKCDAFSDELSMTLDTDQPPEESLRQFGAKLADKLAEHEVIRFSHLVLTEGHAFPALLQDFICGGPHRTEQSLARYLAEVAAAGKLDVPDPVMAAELLMSMISGRWTEAASAATLSGADLDDHNRRKRARIAAAVDLFLLATRQER